MPPMLTSGQASKGEMGKDVQGSREKKRDFFPLPSPFLCLLHRLKDTMGWTPPEICSVPSGSFHVLQSQVR